jgi:cyanophycinase
MVVLWHTFRPPPRIMAMTCVLIGGGRDELGEVLAPFVAAAGPDPVIACVLIDEGEGADDFAAWAAALQAVAPCRPVPVLLPIGAPFEIESLDGADALFVGGGLTPAYAEALVPAASAIRSWLSAGRPYAGYSAGAAIAPDAAVVGGWLLAGRPVCPDDAAEDLVEVTVVDGLGLVELSVDVHAAQWGTLGRMIGAVTAGLVPAGLALDNASALVVDDHDVMTVVGSGAAHLVRPAGSGVSVVSFTGGAPLAV